MSVSPVSEPSTADSAFVIRALVFEFGDSTSASLQSPLTDSNRRPPPYHVIFAAAGGNGFRLFQPFSAQR
jgi:hypothetical protein